MANTYSAFAIDEHSRLWAWGRNGNGQLGVGNTSNQLYPVLVPGFPQEVRSVSSGYHHSAVIDDNGDLYTAGYNGSGQLGDGTTSARHVFQKVQHPEGIGWTLVSCGFYHTVAVDEKGEVYSWGYNGYYQLGHGNTTQYNRPRKLSYLPVLGARIDKVLTPYHETFILFDNGELWSIGYNGHGQQGIGNTNTTTSWVKCQVPKFVKEVESGAYSIYAITDDGELYAWGYGEYGMLGTGTTSNQYIPVKVNVPSSFPVVDVDAGYRHLVVLTEDGSVFTCGTNNYGQILRGSTGSWNTNHNLVQISLPNLNVVDVYALYHTTLVRTEGGQVWAFGYGSYGDRGDGSTTTVRNSPIQVHLTVGIKYFSNEVSDGYSRFAEKLEFISDFVEDVEYYGKDEVSLKWTDMRLKDSYRRRLNALVETTSNGEDGVAYDEGKLYTADLYIDRLTDSFVLPVE